MKIGYATNYLPGYHDHVGGAEKAVLQTAEMIREKHSDVFFLVSPFTLTPPKKTAHRVYGVRIVERFLPFARKYIEVLKWYIAQCDIISFFDTIRILKKERPDLLHIGNIQFLTMGIVLAARCLKIPVIMSVYDYWCFCPMTTVYDVDGKPCRRFHGPWCAGCTPQKMRILQWIVLLFRKPVMDFFLRKISGFIVLSRSSMDILEAYGIPRSKVRVIRVPLPRQTPAKDTGRKEEYVLFIGWLQQRKGFHVLLDAMQRVWTKFPKVKLYAVIQEVKWEKDYARNMYARLQLLGTEKIVLLRGQRSKQQITDLVYNAGVVAIPEQWENMSPLLLIEAMTMAKPIVASAIGGIPEFLTSLSEGLLAQSTQPDDFYYKISYMLTYKENAREMGGRAMEKVRGMLDRTKITEQLYTEYLRWIQR